VHTFNRVLDWLVTASAVLAGLILAFMTLAISAEVVLRSFFTATLEFPDEYSGYMVLAICALGVPYCREKNALLTVDFLIDRLPPAARANVVFIYGVISLVFCILLDFYVTRLWLQTIDRKMVAATLTATPLWIPQMLLPFGLTLLCLVVARKLFRPDRPTDASLAADVSKE
jgi:TRAP-type C4-dicarboxylate transport system permease small subunit